VDVRGVLELHDSTTAAVAARFPGLAGRDVDAALYVLDPGGRWFRGFFAVRRVAWSSPLTWWVLPLLYLAGWAGVGPRLYGWLARNRRGWCGGGMALRGRGR
jgi:hypothetical protein